MLNTDPSKRISCEDVVIHPFFSTPAEHKLSAEGELPNPQQKLESVKELCRILRNRWDDDDIIYLEVKRSDVVTPVLATLADSVGQTSKLHVNFVGEDGVDAGGLTSALYRLFFEQMLAPQHNLFVKRENSSVYLPDPKASPRSLRTVGYMMVRCLLDARAAAIPLAQSVYRWILDLPTKENDLEAVDEHLYRSFSQMIAVPGLDMNLTDFSCFGDIVGEDDDTIVNDQNKHKIISWATNHILIDSIKDQLEALKSGFLSIDGLTQLLKLLSIADLKVLLYGDECAAFRRLFIRAEVVSLTFLLPRLLTADTIIAEIEFREFPQGCQTPDFLKQWLRSADVPTLRSFLIFITEMPNVPAHGFVNPNGSARKISIFFCRDEQKLPTSHTCFLQLDLPAYSSFELLSSKLALALQETRFSIA
jgi:E3 ubiquitin-protein ligase HUWE1